jgi:hypothetical protein
VRHDSQPTSKGRMDCSTATPAVEIGLQTQVSRRMEDMPHLHATFDAVHPAFLYGTYMQY